MRFETDEYVAVCNLGQQSQSSSSAGAGGSQASSSSSSSSSSLPSNLSYTSYILKQTPQVSRNAYSRIQLTFFVLLFDLFLSPKQPVFLLSSLSKVH